MTFFHEENMVLMKYKTIIKLAAEYPHELRLMDINRVMTAVKEQDCLENFRRWLLVQLDKSCWSKDERIQRVKIKIKNWTYEVTA